MMEKDPETMRIESENEAVYDYVNQKGWGIVKELLMKKIAELNTLTALPVDGGIDYINEVKARIGAIELIRGWIAEVEGMANAHEFNLRSKIEDNIIINYERENKS